MYNRISVAVFLTEIKGEEINLDLASSSFFLLSRKKERVRPNKRQNNPIPARSYNP